MFHDGIAHPLARRLARGLAGRTLRVADGGSSPFAAANLDMFFAANTYRGAVPADLTVTRASTAYAEDTSGVWSSFSSNVPRITDKGLLVEEARTNLAIRSNAFDNAAWAKTTLTATADQTTAPDGTTTADLITCPVGSSVQYSLGQSVSFTSGTTYAMSYFIKPGTQTLFQLTFSAGAFSGLGYANYELTGAGSVTATGGTLVGSGVQAYANGWYRIWFIATATATAASTTFLFVISSTTSARVPTNSFSGETFHAWGAQVEAGAFPTSYIPTTTVAVTRAADAVTLTSVAWLTSQSPMSLFAETNIPQTNTGIAYRAVEIDNGTNIARISNSGGNWLGIYNTDGSATAGAVAANVAQKSAVAVAANDLAACMNGGAVGTDASVTALTGLNRVTFGASTLTGSVLLNGYIRRIAYFPSRLANATLQTITSSSGAPSVAFAPVVSGTESEGNVLSVTNGFWFIPPVSYTYQWYRGASAIGGATSNSYTLVDADGGQTIYCVVTGTNGTGSTPIASNTVGPIAEAEPQNTVLPTISGTRTEGETLTASTGTWTNSPSGYTYQWNRNSSPIGSATASTYVLVEADVSNPITVTVTASNAAGAGPPATSLAAMPIAPGDPVYTSGATITGTEAVGSTLTAVTGTWSGSPSYTYQWRRNDVSIGGATSSTYLLGALDEGEFIDVVITGTNAFGAASTTTADVGPIAAAPVTESLELYGGGDLDLYGGGTLELYGAALLALYAGGFLELYGGGILELYNYAAIPANALLLNGIPVLFQGQYILV